MKRYKVTITVGVLASSEQAAWEYGNTLASRAPHLVAKDVEEDMAADEAQVEVEDAD